MTPENEKRYKKLLDEFVEVQKKMAANDSRILPYARENARLRARGTEILKELDTLIPNPPQGEELKF